MDDASQPIRLARGAEVDPASGRYTLPDGRKGRLTALERVTLLVLVAHRGAAVSREALFATGHAGFAPDARGLRAVDQTVSRLRRRVFPEGGGIVSVRGRGYRLDAVDAVEPTPSDGPSDLIGRAAEVTLIESELALSRRPSRHVELVGAGGIGKSALARATLQRAAARGEATAWIGLDGAGTAADALSRLARALSLPIEPHDDEAGLAARVERHLVERPRTLLVLDDVDDAAPVLATLASSLPALRQTRVLLTARRSRAAEWGREGRLVTLAIGPLAHEDAVMLLRSRAREGGDDPTRPDQAARLDELARRVGGWPLALELALGSGAPALATGTLGIDGLRPVLTAMWQALPATERRLLVFVALARGTLTTRTAEGDDDDRTATTVASLQRGGWLGSRRHEGRLELHALVREFVLAQATADDTRAFLGHLAAHAARCLRAPLSMDPRVAAELAELAPSLAIALESLAIDPSLGHVRVTALLALGRHHYLHGPRELAVATADRLREAIADDARAPDATVATTSNGGERAWRRSLSSTRALLLLAARHDDGGRADARLALACSTTAAERVEALQLVARTHRDAPDIAVPALRDALALADGALARARAASVLASSLAREERFDEALAPMARAVDALERLGVETRFAEDNYLAFVLCECGVSAQARRVWDAAAAAYMAHARGPVRPGFVAVRALLSIDEGDLELSHSTVVRFGFFDAWTSLDDNGDTVVSLSFYRDVTALEYIDLRTSLTVATSKPAKTEGSSAHWQSQIGERTTRWLATCSRK